jgi:urea transporter
MKGLDRLLLRTGAALCGVLLVLGLFIAPDWPRRLAALGAALAGLGFFVWISRREH